MFYLNISDILDKKISEIQSRVPLKIRFRKDSEISFNDTLNNALAINSNSDTASNKGILLSSISTSSSKTPPAAVDKEGNDRSKDVQRAKVSRSNSTAYIPEDKNLLMDMINGSIQSASQKYGVDSNLIRAIIKQESSFNPLSLSHSGAQGLMQLMPGTADALKVNDPWDISQNIEGGTKYIKDQLANFNGDIKLALAAYNAGPYNVKKYGGVPPFNETQNYVVKVMDYYKMYRGQ